MSEKIEFDAVIEQGDGGGAYVKIPFDVNEVFGKKRVQVSASFDGEPYRGLLVRMGDPWHILIILKSIREKIGKAAGDQVHVIIEADEVPRTIEVPPALADAFTQAPDALAFFESLAFSHRREYVNWINEAKQESTRQNRVAKAIEMLNNKQKQR